MIGIPVSAASFVYGDNMLVIHNTSKLESMLKKNCNAIAYHVICLSVAMGESLIGHIRLENKPADLLTKAVNGQKIKKSVSLVL